jgi:DNA-binding NarL/FixJ family response regulator
MIKIAIFDDNRARKEGLKLLVEAMEGMQVTGIFEDCRNVIDKIETAQPEVVLMDINMPYVNGIEGLRIIKSKYPKIKVIMQTIFEDDDKILEAISGGADGYIIKQKSPMKLLDGILEVMNGGAPMTPSIALKVLKLFNAKMEGANNSEDFQLTNREKEILKFLVEGYSYKMIADKCFVSYATVNKHVSNIYGKLQVHSVSAAVTKAIRKGLV